MHEASQQDTKPSPCCLLLSTTETRARQCGHFSRRCLTNKAFPCITPSACVVYNWPKSGASRWVLSSSSPFDYHMLSRPTARLISSHLIGRAPNNRPDRASQCAPARASPFAAFPKNEAFLPLLSFWLCISIWILSRLLLASDNDDDHYYCCCLSERDPSLQVKGRKWQIK